MKLNDFVAVIGYDDLAEDEKLLVLRGRKLSRYLSQPFATAEAFTGIKGVAVPMRRTVEDVQDILRGKYDRIPDIAFYMQGDMDTVLERAREMAEEEARWLHPQPK